MAHPLWGSLMPMSPRPTRLLPSSGVGPAFPGAAAAEGWDQPSSLPQAGSSGEEINLSHDPLPSLGQQGPRPAHLQPRPAPLCFPSQMCGLFFWVLQLVRSMSSFAWPSDITITPGGSPKPGSSTWPLVVTDPPLLPGHSCKKHPRTHAAGLVLCGITGDSHQAVSHYPGISSSASLHCVTHFCLSFPPSLHNLLILVMPGAS